MTAFVPSPNVASILHEDALGGLAALDDGTKRQVVLVQLDLHAVAAAAEHQQGAHCAQALQLQLFSEGGHALSGSEEQLHCAAPATAPHRHLTGRRHRQHLHRQDICVCKPKYYMVVV